VVSADLHNVYLRADGYNKRESTHETVGQFCGQQQYINAKLRATCQHVGVQAKHLTCRRTVIRGVIHKVIGGVTRRL
jgi:hypothetical protein